MRRFGGLLILMVVGLAPSVFADSYTYSTAGCFLGTTCSGSTSTMNFGADATLTFTDATAAGVSSGTTISLGSFNFTLLDGTGAGIYNDLFTLNVSFSEPSGVNGNPFVALVSGNVFFSAGGATISFASGSQLFNYDGGSFTLDLNANPIQVSSANPNVDVDATIVSMPEGPSVAMLGVSGLILFAAFFKKLSPRVMNRAS